MQTIELQVPIDEHHQIHLQLPEDWPLQTVKVVVSGEPVQQIQAKPRVFGQFRGKMHIADDFNAELPDEFWLGKDA